MVAPWDVRRNIVVVSLAAMLGEWDIAIPHEHPRLAALGGSTSANRYGSNRGRDEPERPDDERHVVRGKTEPCGNAADTG